MIKTIKEAEAEVFVTPAAKVAGDGVDSTMSKASGDISNPLFYEVHRRI